MGLGEFTEARPEGERCVTTSAALSSPPGECLWYCGLGTRGPEQRKRAGKIVLLQIQVQIFHPPGRPALINTNLVSDCSFDKTQVRTQEAGLQKGAETHTQAQLLSNTLILPTETTYTGDWDTAEFGEQGFTKGREEEKNLDGHPLQSQRSGPSLGESPITDGEVICSSNQINSINLIAISNLRSSTDMKVFLKELHVRDNTNCT